MFCRKMVLCALTLLLAVSAFSQQKQWPKTFLWRISGNGLSKPSYLYGTIHLSDKRLFNFSDSLYHFIEQSEGFDIEVDVDTVVAYSIRKFGEQNKGRTLKSFMKKNEYEKYSEKLSKVLNKPADKITTRDIWLAKNEKTTEAYKKGEMSAFMDLYLYNIAKRQGKKVGGIEDMEDQMDIIDEMFSEADIEFIMSDSTQQATSSFVDKMKNIYISQDLNQVLSLFENSENNKFKDVVLTKRNVKMARRMDSLSHIRNSFFAVGVAHLPGDGGVIELLQKRGFKVEPVFSDKKIAAKSYRYKEVDVPWVQYTHDLKLYNVEVPGVPLPMDMYKQVMDMRYYLDLPTSKVYFTAVINSVMDSTKRDSVFTAMIEKMSAKGSVKSKKSITRQSFEGRDVLLRTSDGENLRMQVFLAGGLVYMTMITTKDLAALSDISSKRFFESFTMTPHLSFSKPYIQYTDTTAAFSVSLPDQPAITEEAETETTGDVKSYAVHDYNSGNYYLITVRNTVIGNYIPNDTAFLNVLRTNFAQTMQDDTSAQLTSREGFPALIMNGSGKNENAYYQTLSLLRGNRTYTLMVVSSKMQNKNALADSFFRSFKMIGYPAATWKNYSAGDSSFSAWLPAAFATTRQNDDEIADTTLDAVAKIEQAKTDFVSRDESNASSYHISRTAFDEYFWATNDSILFRNAADLYKSEGDSIVSFKLFQFRNDKAADVELEHGNNSVVKKLRFILHNDSLYKLYSFSPRFVLNNENSQRFFSEFKIVSASKPATVFNNKTRQLVADLASSDSSVFDKASTNLADATLPISELRLFYPLLVTPLRDFTQSGYNTNVELGDRIAEIADSSTVDFIVQQYPLLKDEARGLQYPLLRLLASMEQRYANEAVQKLIKLPPAPGGNPSVFVSTFYDTLAFAKSLLPEIMSFTKDTTAALEYASLITRLIDSNLVKKDEVLPYLNNFIGAAEQQKKRINSNEGDYAYKLRNVLNLFGQMNNPEANAQLQQYNRVNDLYLQYITTNWLIQNKQPILSETINKLAASDEYRRYIFDTLRSVNKLHLFPAAFHTQKMLAASYVHTYASGDDSYPDSVNFVAEKIINYKGKRQKFYLFKVLFSEDDEKSYYLGVAGPFALDTKKVTSDNDATGLYWREPFSTKDINLHFNEYLKQLEAPAEE